MIATDNLFKWLYLKKLETIKGEGFCTICIVRLIQKKKRKIILKLQVSSHHQN